MSPASGASARGDTIESPLALVLEAIGEELRGRGARAIDAAFTAMTVVGLGKQYRHI